VRPVRRDERDGNWFPRENAEEAALPLAVKERERRREWDLSLDDQVFQHPSPCNILRLARMTGIFYVVAL